MKSFFTTARTTALLYLGLAVTGVLAFLFVRAEIYMEGDAVVTATNLIENESLARIGIAAELALVGFQALTAVWFYKLFKKKNSFAAGLIAVFGMVNATAILIATAMWLGALDAAIAGQVEQSMLLFNVHEYIWDVASLFFGLWLLPMAYMARLYKLPKALYWFLILGGVGYILAAFVLVLAPDQSALAEALPMPATIGEFWIIGYLFFKSSRFESSS